MKKILTSAGIVAFGAANLQAQPAAAPHLTSFQTTKPWSVSASLRGFYDDNYVTLPSKAPPGRPELHERDSFGFEISPSVGFNWVLPQTTLGLSYIYGLKYYEDRPKNRVDHSHQADAKISHAFTERYKLDVSDSFVSAQEPEIIDKGLLTTLKRNGDAIRNTASINLTAGLTEQLGTVLGYSHSLYDYKEATIGAILDRHEHLFTVNLRWQAVPSTVGILGYQFGLNRYDDDQVLQPRLAPLLPDFSDIRDNQSHYAYVGVDHSFNPQLNGSVRVGAQFTEYNNLPAGSTADDSMVSPYADANATWTYNPGCYVQLGVRHTRQATDITNYNLVGTPTPTLDQEATSVYTTINHKITPTLTGNLLAQFQHGVFQAGGADDESENFLLVGLNLSYEINKFLSADAGYNFDRLDSDLANRSFSRNRIYVGIRATY